MNLDQKSFSRTIVNLDSQEEIKSVIAKLDNGESIVVSIKGKSIIHITHNNGEFSLVEGEGKEVKKKGGKCDGQ